MMRPFYLTTTLPYVNANLHMGHALEFVRADTIARYHIEKGEDVYFNSGTDEHGLKIYERAVDKGMTPQAFVDEAFLSFKEQVASFGVLESIHFTRTTDRAHEIAAQAFWQKVYDNGYIYKKNYQAKYCVGCESEKTDSELVEGECPDHPGRPLEIIEEENYFFRFSAFSEKLSDFYQKNPEFVVPAFRFNEVKAFVERGLEDFSISRLASKMPWGVPVPGDEAHVMYVWFDALTNYISTLGWGSSDETIFQKYWREGTPTQYCGKDNTRFQAVMWQAMLMAAGVENSHTIVVNGHITAEGGVKMSKTLGNVVDPREIALEYGTDSLRYFLLKEISDFEDSPFSLERFASSYNAGLANGLGNLLSRTLAMASGLGGKVEKGEATEIAYEVHGFSGVEKIGGMTVEGIVSERILPKYTAAFDAYEISKATNAVWELIGILDRLVARTEPYKLAKTDPKKAEGIIYDLLFGLETVMKLVRPMLPETAQKMEKVLTKEGEVFVVSKLETPLFPRK